MNPFPPIAIVGRGCVLPGALTPEKLWEKIARGEDLVGGVPKGRWGVSPERFLRPSAASMEDVIWSDRGGYVEGFDFDPQGWAIPPGELAGLDPLFTWVLHSARRALLEASSACRPGNPLLSRTGLVLGNLSYPSESLSRLAEEIWSAGRSGVDPRNRFVSGLPALLTARALGLGGGAFALDAACASSLYAIRQACDRLHDGSADLMLAGAVNAADGLFLHVGFTALSALSRSGRSRPFHRDADGLLPAEGAVILALRRLEDAVRDGARILGVIRGVGLSNDGSTGGFLAPSEDGQARAMADAYAMARVEPAEISLVECHATGTSVGDATEIRSMSRVFEGCAEVPIGSLKSNLGHLITASGAGGLLKILGAIEARIRPPTLHASEPLEALEGSPFRLLRSAEPWNSRAPLKAAVSSFGFGGNNAHLIVEEWTGVLPRRTESRRPGGALAIVGLEVAAGGGAFLDSLASGEQTDKGLSSVEVRTAGLRFPPRDLEQCLGQQTLVLELARRAVAQAGELPAARTSVLVGMGCDPESARHGARWRVDERFAPPLTSAAVVGTMPNIPANRINAQFGFQGPSHTVSAEELSGLAALEIAARALRSGEIDAAVVAAVDLSREPVHEHAASSLLPEGLRIAGDAGVALVLRRLEDAREEGARVLAVLPDPRQEPSGPVFSPDDAGDFSLTPVFGHSHAASGLLHLSAAALACRHGFRPATGAPWLESERAAVVRVSSALGPVSTRLSVRSGDEVATPLVLERLPGLHSFSGASRTELARALSHGSLPETFAKGPARLVLLAEGEDELRSKLTEARRFLENGGPAPEGVYYRDRPLGGELAFVFPMAAAAYAGMGRELLLAFPEVTSAARRRLWPHLKSCEWMFDGSGEPSQFEQLAGYSLLSFIHASLSRDVLGLRPAAAIGLCTGESCALSCLGAWNDTSELFSEIDESGLYTRELAGELNSVRRAWGATGAVDWATWRLLAPVEAVRAALEPEARAHLAIIHSSEDCLIVGDAAACERVVSRAGGAGRRVEPGMAIHCPEVEPFVARWRAIHRRAVRAPEGVRFYSGATGTHYALNDDSVADALTRQALGTVDYPRVIDRAWRDGARVFLEHGPRGLCSKWIGSILNDREHVAIAWDTPGRSSARRALEVAAELLAAGVDCKLDALTSRLLPKRSESAAFGSMIRLPARRSLPGPRALEPELMRPAPVLRPVHSAIPASSSPNPVSSALAAIHADVSRVHSDWIRQCTEAQLRFLSQRSSAPESREFPGPRLDRSQLEIHARGRISSIFGPSFEGQDGFARQVRMPAPPLLLADRVLGIEGEPGSLGLGKTWTETDVGWDSWFVHRGRMLPGLMIEAGQADLLLISWLGIDAENRGERVYRLLGCELEFRESPARPGDTLRYEIRVEGYANQGATRLFFFSYDCEAAGRPLLSVRGGQAGFFTDAELAATGGILWDAKTVRPVADAVVAPPFRLARDTWFDETRLRAFADGKPHECFGPGFELAAAQVEPPRIPGGRLLLMDTVECVDPRGGPWGRGYLKATKKIGPDDWFFDGHFENDPCMPGTLMFDGCLQAMSFYLAALGFTLERDAWRFEPVTGEKYKLACRGQVTPRSRELTYELFVEELREGPCPTLFADLLCTVDGVKAFHCRRMGFRLVPDHPITARALPEGRSSATPVEAIALGRPSEAFGDAYRRFDEGERVSRLPAPPYQFVSRVLSIEGDRLLAEWEPEPGAWYFSKSASGNAAFCALLEAALQPCGWLALQQGCPLDSLEPLSFRNLDGTARWLGQVPPGSGPLQTETRLLSITRSSEAVLVMFEARCRLGGECILEMKTGFGYFTPQALAEQRGLSPEDRERQSVEAPSNVSVDLRDPPRNLMILDRITRYVSSEGLTAIRGEADVRPDAWYFKAHFYQDPVQPGSLGLEAMLQLVEFHGARSGRNLAPDGEPFTWKYRGQVLPSHRRVVADVEIRGSTAEGRLWADGVLIYRARFGVRERESGIIPPAGSLPPGKPDET